MNKLPLLALLLTLITACGPAPKPVVPTTDDEPSLNLPFLAAPGMDTLAPQATGLVVSSTPTDGATGVSSSAALQLTLSSAGNKAKVETAYALYPGKYDPSSTPASFTKLGLTSMCAGRLRVRNPNAFPLSFQWDAYNTPERGVGVVPASSDVYFTASPTATIRVFVGTGLQNTKAQNTALCGARDFIPTWSADGKSVSLQPSTPLTVGQDYTLTLSTLAADTTGNTLAAPLAVRFDTRVSNTGGDPSQLNLGVRVLPSFAGLEFTRVDGGLALTFSSSAPVWNPGSKVFSAQVTAKNTSSAPYANVRAILKSFAPGNVSVVSPSGFTGDNLPFIDFGALGAGESKTLTWKFYAPDAQPFTFSASALSLSAAQNTLALSSVSPSSFANNVTTSVTLQGAGIRQETAFFIESTRLAVSSWSATSATVSVPYGFLPGSYGIMAVNPDGTRAVLYPALTIAEGPTPRAADPRERAFSFADGFVLNFKTKQGIAGAKITAKIVAPGGVQTLSATSVSDGYYLLRGLPIGTHQVKIEAPGFEPVYRTAVITDPGTDSSKGATVHLKYAALEPSAYQTTYIGSAGGTHYASTLGEDGPFLVIPPGALDQDTPIRFTHLRAAETLPELPQDGYYLAFARLEPVGLTFKKPATLYLPLQSGIKLTDGTPIKISYFDARENRWVQDITAGTIVTRPNGKQYLEYEINHFTWIGGQWSPDPVSGCVTYASGGVASGVQTNYGVTNSAGCYSGTTTQSNAAQTLTAGLVGKPGSPTVQAPYNGNGPVTFPTLVLPDPAPLNVASPDLKFPCDGLAGYSIPSPGFSAQSLPAQPSSSTFSSQSTSLSSQSFNTTEKTLLVSSSTYGFTSQVFGGAFTDPSKIRVTLDGQDVTATVNINPTSSTSHTLDYQLDKPLRSGLGRRIEVSAGIESEARVVGALEADVASKIRVVSTQIWAYTPDDLKPNEPFNDSEELVSSDDYVSFDTPESQALGDDYNIEYYPQGSSYVNVGIHFQTLDENNNLLEINDLKQPTFKNLTSVQSSDFNKGESFAIVKIKLNDFINGELPLPSFKLSKPSINLSSQSLHSLEDNEGCYCETPFSKYKTDLTPKLYKDKLPINVRPFLPGLAKRAQNILSAKVTPGNKLSLKLEWQKFQAKATGTTQETTVKFTEYRPVEGLTNVTKRFDGTVVKADGRVYTIEAKYNSVGWNSKSPYHPDYVPSYPKAPPNQNSSLFTNAESYLRLSWRLGRSGVIYRVNNPDMAAYLTKEFASRFPEEVAGQYLKVEVIPYP